MANPIGLLLMGLLCSGVIGRINHSSKVFFTCVLAMALGFVVGASISKIMLPLEKDALTIVTTDNTEKGESLPMLCALEASVIQKSFNRYSSMASKEDVHVDNLYPVALGVKTDHRPRCLSPPFYIYTGYSIPVDCSTC